MKKVKIYLGYCVLFTLLLAGCSKDETSQSNPDNSSETATITFGAVLNDLVNRAMAKQHFDQIPDCSDAEPAIAVLEISYGDVTKTVSIEILQDEEGYFTAYTDDLKIPVPSDGTTSVTLSEFMVYDGDTSSGTEGDPYFSTEYGNLIWIAPISSEEGQFDGYVDNPLPITFELSPGTKPYIDVEVLCFDRRMANEYGYVFFDIDQKEVFNFCLFGNYCTPAGRHYVASYSVDVWKYENDVKTVQLYSDETRTVVDGAADPLCFNLPDDPDVDDEEYYFEITLLNSDEYDAGADAGTIIRQGVLTEMEAKLLFDPEDDTKLDYYHFFVGEGCNSDDTPPIFTDPDSDATTYYACLRELNDSNVAAIAYVTLDGNELRTQIAGFNLQNGVHPQHIHGMTDDSFDSTCPDISADSPPNGDGDGLLEINEGAPFYGGPQLFLTTSGPGDNTGTMFPTTTTGVLMYDRTITLGAAGFPSMADMTPLNKKTIVLHGLNVQGQGYVATLPIACGQLEDN